MVSLIKIDFLVFLWYNSLAIGKEGQNARLAAKLTGLSDWRIDIKSETQFRNILMEKQAEMEKADEDNDAE